MICIRCIEPLKESKQKASYTCYNGHLDEHDNYAIA